MLPTFTLALVHSTPEYGALVWCRSPHTHLIDPTDALRTVTGYLHPTPADKLSTNAGTQPAEFCHKGDTLSLVCLAMAPRRLLHCSPTH